MALLAGRYGWHSTSKAWRCVVIDRKARILFAIEYYQRTLRLSHWQIEYCEDTTGLDPDCLSDIDMFTEARHATIRVAEDVAGDQIERCIAHELMHIVVLDYQRLTCHTLAKTGDVALGVIDMLEEMLETIVEVVAEGLTGVPYDSSVNPSISGDAK